MRGWRIAQRLLPALVAGPLLAQAPVPGPSGGGAAAPVGAAVAPLRLPRFTAPVTLDGKPDELVWQTAMPLPLVTYRPRPGEAPGQPSDVRVGYDDHFFYVAGRLRTSGPDGLRRNSLYRDRLAAGDYLRIMLDTFHDQETGVSFAASPDGVRTDFAQYADGNTSNFDWNARWDAEARITEDGYTVEMRIPFTSLRFRQVDGEVRMALMVERWSPAAGETSTYPEVSPEFSNALRRVSLAQPVILEGIAPRQEWLVSPYLLGGTARVASRAPGTPPGAFRHQEQSDFEGGVDVRTALSAGLTLDLTANTDFAQVEVDDQQVNLSRFSLFFPEKRQFFQERAGLMTFETGGADRLFHSRRIGLDDRGNPVRIYGGGRVSGRAGLWELGALAMQTDLPEGAGEGSEHFGVYRARRQLGARQNFVGGIATARLRSGRSDFAYGVDALAQVGRNHFLTVQWAQTLNAGRDERGLSGGMGRMSFTKPSDRGTAYSLAAKWSGRDHLPSMGFASLTDFVQLNGNLRYGWWPGGRSPLRSLQPSLQVARTTSNADGRVETAGVTQFLNYDFAAGLSGFGSATWNEELLRRDLPLGKGVTVPAGRYTITRFFFFVGLPPGWSRRASASIQVGQLYDGRQVQLSLFPNWIVSPHLELGADLIRNRITFATRQQTLDADLVRFRVRAATDRRLSMTAFLQYSRLADLVVGNVRLRYNVSEGRDLYLVINESVNTDLERLGAGEPLLLRSQDRTVTIKYSHVFGM